MTDHPYTDDEFPAYTDGDLIAEATHQHRRLVEAPDRKTVGAELDADWDGGADLTEDERADAVDAVYDLLCGAADVSEWAVRLGADGLEPDPDRQLTLDVGPRLIARVLFAFDPHMPAMMRDALVTGLDKAIDDVLEQHRHVGETFTPLTGTQLEEIETRAAHFREYGGLPLDADPLVETDIPALLAEVKRLQAELERRPSRAAAWREAADQLREMQRQEPDHRHAAGLYAAEMALRRALREDLAPEGDAETVTEWGVRHGADVDVRDDRADAAATLARWRDTDPAAELVTRTVHHGPWQATEAGDR